ncbi:MAG: hypothetical protein AMJ56_16600 [Anaerolineae bacterium SG8_19]|nr:MAG: hypothetical protein AMJ56_16600 [Anaerolineae bacterium SG8_19]
MVKTRSSSLLTGITIVLIICCFGMLAHGKYGGGSGEPNDPYLINDANHMQAIGADSNDWDKHFKLGEDIDLSAYTGEEFNIIGYKTLDPYENWPFTGVFDGNGHTISNFTYDSNVANDIGLFGYVNDPNAKIKNLGLSDTNVTIERGYNIGSLVGEIHNGDIIGCFAVGGSINGGMDTGGLGGLVGTNRGATISDCFADVAVTADVFGIAAGGLVGYNVEGIITRCSATGDVVGNAAGGLIGELGKGYVSDCYAGGDVYGSSSFSSNTGGLVGEVVNADISNSHSSGDVHGHDDVGGLVGKIAGPQVEVSNCYSTGDVNGTRYTGGFVGRNIGLILDCYSVGNVLGIEQVGGLVGQNSDNGTYAGIITNSYWDTEISGEPNMCGYQGPNATGCDNIYGKNTAQLHQQSTFTDWDFINVWDIGENQTYPYLRTVSPGDINKDHITNLLDIRILCDQWLQE